MRVNEHIRYEPDEKCPLTATLGVALQGSVLAVSTSVTIAVIFTAASGGGEQYASWVVFASLIVGGAATALQAARFNRLGSGHLLLMGPAAPFMAVCVLAATHGGLAAMSSLVAAASLIHFAMAFWLARLRRIITPVVSGVSLMVIAVSVMPIGAARLNEVPAGLPPAAGLAIAAITVAAAAVLMLRGSGICRLMAIPITILAGCTSAALMGAYDFQAALDAPWLALPQFSGWPGLGQVMDRDVLALLPVFLVVSAVIAVKASNEGAAIHQASRRRPGVVDFRGVQGTLNAGGAAVLASGIAGIIPVLIYLPTSVALITFTGSAARRAGYVIGAIVIGLAFMPKAVALILTIPTPVTGSVLMIVMGLLFMEGARSVFQDGINQQKAVIAGVSLSIGVGLQAHNIVGEALGSPWGAAFGNGIVPGVMAALVMSTIMDLTVTRRRRVETVLDMSALPGIQEFLKDTGNRMSWELSAVERLCAAGEETLSSMLELRDEYEGNQPPRMVITALPRDGAVEMEFLAVSAEENIEDRIAYMSEQAQVPEIEEISFRLLRHYASSVRHRKYHGIDIVTVLVKA